MMMKAPKPTPNLVAGLVERILLPLVFLVALFLRVYRLDSVPRGVLYDEAYNGIDALRILGGARPIFLPENYGREALFQYFQALSIGLLGPLDWALRLPAVVSGVLTLPVSYLLVRRLFGPRVALLTCAWLAVSLWHVMFSRIGLRTILLPLALAAAFFFIWKGLDRVNPVPAGEKDGRADAGAEVRESTASRCRYGPVSGLGWFALAGGMLGVSLYTYTTARFAPLVVLALAGYLALLHRPLFWRALPGFFVAGTLTILVFAPEGWYFAHHPWDFVTRAREVSALNPNLDASIGLESPRDALLYSVLRSLGMFTFLGDEQWDRNIPGRPVFDPISSAFFILGLILVARRAREPRYAFLLLWLVIMLVPSMVSIRNVPDFLRVTGLIPGVFALPAIGFDCIWSALEKRVPGWTRCLLPTLVGLVFLGGALRTYVDYFDLWAQQPSVAETFNADRWLAITTGRGLARAERKPIFVGAGYSDGPLQRYALRGRDQTDGIWLFDGMRSLVFPSDGRPVTYVFAHRDLPPPTLFDRYFRGATGQTVATAPDGDRIVRYELQDDHPSFAPEHSLEARFGDILQVYGYDLPRDVQDGQSLTVRWYWKIIGSDRQELAFFNQLYDADGQRHGQLDDRAFAPGYWPLGTTGISTFDLKVDRAAPTGVYWLLVGVYVRHSLDRLPVVDGMGRKAGNQIRLGPIKVHGQPPPAPIVPHAQPTRLADGVEFLGYGLDAPARPGAPLGLTLYWSARSRPSHDYTIFVHLLDNRDHIVAQADAPPRDGRYPTSVWDRGEIIEDRHVLTLSPNLPPGTYRLEIGMYQLKGGRRLSVVGETGQPRGDRILISDVPVR